MVLRCDPLIKFSIERPAEIIATGNGNAIDQTLFQLQQPNTCKGMCPAIVHSFNDQTGAIHLRAEWANFQSAETSLFSGYRPPANVRLEIDKEMKK